MIEERLREYDEDTRPLIDHYRERGVLLEVDGNRPVDEITADLIKRATGPKPPRPARRAGRA